MITRKKQSMDGNTAAATVSYAFTEVAAIYPITPSSVMAELTDAWSATGLKNIFGEEVKVNYTTDDGSSGNAIWNGTVAPDDSITFNVTSSLNLTPGYRKITAWTEILPPSVDWNRDNDTIVYEVVSCDGAMNGNYAIGNVTGVPSTRTFESFGQVFKMLEVCGVGAPVTIKVAQPAEGVFSDVLKFPTNIQGASTTNRKLTKRD